MFQSTHPRGVRLKLPFNVRVIGKFQSTHPRGVRPSTALPISWPTSRFNPRTRVGCDALRGALGLLCGKVSIHAPAWGATPCPSVPMPSSIMFQSTHPRGVRHDRRTTGNATGSFNPRTRVGCDDLAKRKAISCRMVSIHAPAWGATNLDCSVFRLMPVFQSTHPRGVRRSPHEHDAATNGVSIHAPAWGATSSS